MSPKLKQFEFDKIAVVGAAGRMGKWFVDYFDSRARVVNAYDIKPIPKLGTRRFDIRISKQLDECISGADVILICVPVLSVPGVVRKCAELAKSGSIIAEIASVKKKSFAALAKTSSNILPLCIHPMFGPGAGYRDLRWILVPVRNKRIEFKAAKALFADSDFIVLKDWSVHDSAMGIILGLTYFVNLAFADVISRSNVPRLMRLAGTTFTVQSVLAESIISEDPSLISAIIASNPHAWTSIGSFLSSCDLLQNLMKNEKKLIEAVSSVNARLRKSQDMSRSYRLMYDVLSSIKQTKN